MATHSSILAGEIPWTEEPGGLQHVGSRRVRHGSGTEQQQNSLGNGSVVLNKQVKENDVTKGVEKEEILAEGSRGV